MRPRHIEIQLLGDHHGTVDAVRRARVLDPAAPSESGRGDRRRSRRRRRTLRRRMADAAAAVAAAAGYTNAGTIEFLLDEDGSFYFLEMNTRLQVEHPVTEMVDEPRSGALADPHRARRAARPSIPERALTPHGHAIECRIYAEDPDQGFMPSPGPRARHAAPPAARASATTAASPPATRCRSSTTR